MRAPAVDRATQEKNSFIRSASSRARRCYCAATPPAATLRALLHPRGTSVPSAQSSALPPTFAPCRCRLQHVVGAVHAEAERLVAGYARRRPPCPAQRRNGVTGVRKCRRSGPVPYGPDHRVHVGLVEELHHDSALARSARANSSPSSAEQPRPARLPIIAYAHASLAHNGDREFRNRTRAASVLIRTTTLRWARPDGADTSHPVQDVGDERVVPPFRQKLERQAKWFRAESTRSMSNDSTRGLWSRPTPRTAGLDLLEPLAWSICCPTTTARPPHPDRSRPRTGNPAL